MVFARIVVEACVSFKGRMEMNGERVLYYVYTQCILIIVYHTVRSRSWIYLFTFETLLECSLAKVEADKGS